jgi:hypothetical protein
MSETKSISSYKTLLFRHKQLKERLLIKVDYLEETEIKFRLIDLRYLMKEIYSSASAEEKKILDLLK